MENENGMSNIDKNQAAQGIMQGIGDTANTFNSLRRTNNGRTYAGQGK